MEVRDIMHHDSTSCRHIHCGHDNVLEAIEELIDATYSVHRRLSTKMAKLSEQVEQLRTTNQEMLAAIEAEKAEVTGKLDELSVQVTTLEAKVVELGEVDPDLTDVINSMRANIEQVQGIVATPVAEPAPAEEAPEGEAPAEEAPVAEPAPDAGEVTGGDVLNPSPVIEAPAEAPAESPTEAPAEGGDTGTGEASPVDTAPAEPTVPAGDGSDAGADTTGETPAESPADGGETFPADDTTGGTAGEGTDTGADAGAEEPRA
jgi:outer membrane murein-binding lipoprotein Lpp